MPRAARVAAQRLTRAACDPRSGTSVGAKTLSLKSAVIIAIIFEFTGALVLGRVSQETIAGGIADIGAFTTDPEFCACTMHMQQGTSPAALTRPLCAQMRTA